jgi:hypothetical protein
MAGAVLACGLMAAVGVGVGSLVHGQLAALIAVFVWAMAVEQLVGGLAPRSPGSCRCWPPPPWAAPTAPPACRRSRRTSSLGAIVVLLTGLALLLATVTARTTVRRDIT